MELKAETTGRARRSGPARHDGPRRCPEGRRAFLALGALAACALVVARLAPPGWRGRHAPAGVPAGREARYWRRA